MSVLVDDVGSFPLPPNVNRAVYEKAYDFSRSLLSEGKRLMHYDLSRNFCDVVVQSFRRKLDAGLDVVSYPQLFGMYRQQTDAIESAMEKGTYIVERKYAVLPEVQAIAENSKVLSEEFGRTIPLRVCVTGPMELYLRLVGTTLHEDVLLMFTETVKCYAENALFNSKHMKTEVVAIDEPSFGFQEINADIDAIVDALEKTLNFSGDIKQIHLHSASRLPDLMNVPSLDVLSFEFGASPKNIEAVPKRMFDEVDKRLRVGITRTDYDSLLAESRDKTISLLQDVQMVENEGIIRDRLKIARLKFEDCIAFAGPDCGLGGWPTQEAAELLLKRTVTAVKTN